MVTPISQATPVQAPQTAAPAARPAPQPPTQPARLPEDTVQLSAAAKLMQEASETPALTLKEAGAGDLQAKRLLAREEAAHAGH